MTFTQILNELTIDDDHAELSLTEDWAQGRATFGGLVTAALLRVMRSRIDPDRACRSLLTSFAGPVVPGRAHLSTAITRRGRSATFAEGRAVQAGEPRCLVLASFGRDRESSVHVSPDARPDAPGPAGLPDLPTVPGVTPAFTQHFVYRWTADVLPFSGAERAAISGWCRLRDDDAPASEELVAALVDAWPAPVLPLLDRPAPASTVTWALDFVHVDPAARANDWWYFQSCAEAASAGYAQCRAQLWDPAGALAAVSRQTVAVFA